MYSNKCLIYTHLCYCSTSIQCREKVKPHSVHGPFISVSPQTLLWVDFVCVSLIFNCVWGIIFQMGKNYFQHCSGYINKSEPQLQSFGLKRIKLIRWHAIEIKTFICIWWNYNKYISLPFQNWWIFFWVSTNTISTSTPNFSNENKWVCKGLHLFPNYSVDYIYPSDARQLFDFFQQRASPRVEA